MRRLHVHLAVENLNDAIQFYSHLFGEQPTRLEDGYAKWQLENPRVNFAISVGSEDGTHLGIEAADSADFDALRKSGERTGRAKLEEEDRVCCFARSDKLWVEAPGGLKWELFNTHETVSAQEQASADVKRMASPCGCC